MAAFVQTKRDLGCKAPQVTVLEEGINTDSRWATEFWSLLGGNAQYRGPKRLWIDAFCLPVSLQTRLLILLSVLQELVSQMRTRCMRAACWTLTVCTDSRETNWCLMKMPGPLSRVSHCSTLKR